MVFWLSQLRPKQWIKNGFIFAALFFSGKFTETDAWIATFTATLCFLLASCAVYVVNDIQDRTEDRTHPVKKNRPIADGKITSLQATYVAIFCAAAALYLLTWLPYGCAVVIALYAGLNLLYTAILKKLALIDLFTLAFFYVLRVLMGCYAAQVTVSPWIILATFLLALFLGFGKRYHEMGIETYVQTKPNLQHYSRELLDKLVIITGGAALLTYAIYAAEVAERTGKVEMIYTVAFVAFGLFRYLQSVYVYKQGGEPETIILCDKWQLINLAVWLVTTLLILF